LVKAWTIENAMIAAKAETMVLWILIDNSRSSPGINLFKIGLRMAWSEYITTKQAIENNRIISQSGHELSILIIIGFLYFLLN